MGTLCKMILVTSKSCRTWVSDNCHFMIKKIVFTLLGLLVILVVLILVQSVDPVQIDPKKTVSVVPENINPEELSLDSLWEVVGDKKTVPKGFEKAALVAYSAYPQLKEVNIEMVLTQSGAPMESNFDLKTLFGSGENRVYRVLLNNAQDSGFEPILLRNLPFDAQVGILAHELGHVAYYHQLTTLQIAKWGVLYVASSDFRAKHERSTDLMPLYHGLGHQIYHYAWYVRNDPSCKPLYEQFGSFIDKYYLTDTEIKDAMENHALYQNVK